MLHGQYLLKLTVGDVQSPNGTIRAKNFRSAGIGSSRKALATRLSPPPAGTQIRSAMDALYGMS